MLLAASARTSLSIAGALAAVLAAAAFHTGDRPAPLRWQESADGVVIEASLANPEVVPGSVVDLDLTITVPKREATPAPRAIAIVLDRSGSMLGEPLADAKRAANRMIDQLRAGDELSVITYSDDSETVVPLSRVTEESKRSAQAAVDAIVADGGTCISCGLTSGKAQLDLTTQELRRMIVISDGQASIGIRDRDELVEHAAIVARSGPISAIGVGLDFDETTMRRIAVAGHGNYYFTEQARGLDEIFTRELADVDATFGTNVTLRFSTDRAGLYTALDGDGPLHEVQRLGCSHGLRTQYPLADLRSGEVRHLTMRVQVPKDADGPHVVAMARLSWFSMTHDHRVARDTAIATTP